MTRKTHPDVWRGMKEQRTAIPLLQQRWPAVFPQDPRQVRPLASTIVATIVTELGWSKPYTKGVLNAWKERVAYCNAVLRYDERVDLAGTPGGDLVSEPARAMARTNLAAIAQHRQRRAEREAEATQSIATTAAAEPASPVTVKASPSPPAAANPAASGRRSRPILTLTSMRAAQ